MRRNPGLTLQLLRPRWARHWRRWWHHLVRWPNKPRVAGFWWRIPRVRIEFGWLPKKTGGTPKGCLLLLQNWGNNRKPVGKFVFFSTNLSCDFRKLEAWLAKFGDVMVFDNMYCHWITWCKYHKAIPILVDSWNSEGISPWMDMFGQISSNFVKLPTYGNVAIWLKVRTGHIWVSAWQLSCAIGT